MRAVVITRPGGPEVLELKEVATPTPARGEVRVRVRATAVNRADLLQRMGLYPAPPDAPSDIPGLEFAGEVDAVGEGVALEPGARVLGLAGGGTYAEALVVPARTVARMPEGMSFTDAAAIPEAFVTAYDAMVTQAQLAAGETVLIHAVGSGVGTAGLQVARALGARCLGTSRTAAKLTRCRALGLDEGNALLLSEARFAEAVRAATGGEGADVVMDLVGGAYLAEDLRALRERGRLVVVGLTGGVRAELDLALLLRKRLTVRGTVLRARPLEEKIAVTQVLQRNLLPLFARGSLHAVIDRVLPLDAAAQAHAQVGANESFGKVVLTI